MYSDGGVAISNCCPAFCLPLGLTDAAANSRAKAENNADQVVCVIFGEQLKVSAVLGSKRTKAVNWGIVPCVSLDRTGEPRIQHAACALDGQRPRLFVRRENDFLQDCPQFVVVL